MRPNHLKEDSNSLAWDDIKYESHFHRDASEIEGSFAIPEASISIVCELHPAKKSTARKSVGGLAMFGFCGMNSAGTWALASSPRICSRSI